MKRLMGFILFFLMLFSLLNYSPTISYACSCAQPGPVKEEVERSSAVFTGKVIEMADTNKIKFLQSSADLIKVRFEADEVWKGKSQSEIIVYTVRDSASCGFEFEQNQEYLVYANESDGKIRVSFCSRTNLLSAASTDIQELGKGEKPIKKISTNSNDNAETQQPQEQSTNYKPYIIAVSFGLLLLVAVFLIRRIKK